MSESSTFIDGVLTVRGEELAKVAMALSSPQSFTFRIMLFMSSSNVLGFSTP